MNIIVCAKQIPDISEMKIDPSSNKPILKGTPPVSYTHLTLPTN